MRITIPCPHCGARTVKHSATEVSDLQCEMLFRCTDIECGHTFAAMLTAVRTVKQSAKPNANVQLPLSTSVMSEAKKRQRTVGGGSQDKAGSRRNLKLLDHAQINKIRELNAQGISTAELCERYSVSRSKIGNVLKSS
ncbi:ogr/Delta-like zinc finger family protein [Burkholderia vietnamiensis]|nr:ogr/Delta-like zinc finger family protein [Burkholderia vietnamiensis]